MKTLIVIDMQNDFLTGSLRNEEAIKVIPNVVEEIKSLTEKDTIITTQDTHQENYLETQEGKMLPVEHCLIGTEGWKLTKEVEDALAYAKTKNILSYNILKPTFGYTDWKNTAGLTNIGKEDEIEIIGVCTDICVVSNALILKALYPEISISVKANCCAGITPESHEAALKTMEMCQIKVIR